MQRRFTLADAIGTLQQCPGRLSQTTIRIPKDEMARMDTLAKRLSLSRSKAFELVIREGLQSADRLMEDHNARSTS